MVRAGLGFDPLYCGCYLGIGSHAKLVCLERVKGVGRPEKMNIKSRSENDVMS